MRDTGGYKSLADPNLTGQKIPIFWRPEECASVIILSPQRNATFGSAIRKTDLQNYFSYEDLENRQHFFFNHKNLRTQIFIPEGLAANEFLQATIPLDPFMLARLAATEEFLRVISGKQIVKKSKPSLTMLRLHKALRALDAMAEKASQREIAELFYGKERIRKEYWKTSSIRQSILRLCRLGQKMVDGGYVELLHQ